MNVIKLVFCILGITTLGFGCDSEKQVGTQSVQGNSELVEEVEASVRPHLGCKMRDTITSNGSFLKFYQIDSTTFSFKWGNEQFERDYEDSFECFSNFYSSEICDFTPKLELITDDFLALKCGTESAWASSCNFITYKCIFLPLNENIATSEIQNFIKFDDEYVIFYEGWSILIENVRTWESQQIKLDPIPLIVFKTLEHSFDTIYIDNKHLNTTYVYLPEDSDEEQHFTTKVKLNI